MNSNPFHFQVGNFACTVFLDGMVPYPPAMFFTNLRKEEYESLLSQRGQGSKEIEVPYTCLFINTGRERVLVDTGAGNLSPTAGNLLPQLRSDGIEPGEIDTVVLSHGHPDHIGGTLKQDGKPAFPNARYVLFRIPPAMPSGGRGKSVVDNERTSATVPYQNLPLKDERIAAEPDERQLVPPRYRDLLR